MKKISVTIQNVAPISVTIDRSGKGGSAIWGSIGGTITDQTDLVEYVNRTLTSFDMQSQDGSIFTIVVSNDGQLLVIPEGSTAPVIVTLPTIAGTEKVWYTLAAIAGDVTGSPTPTRTWQWQRSSNGVDWVDITGATTTTYTLALIPDLNMGTLLCIALMQLLELKYGTTQLNRVTRRLLQLWLTVKCTWEIQDPSFLHTVTTTYTLLTLQRASKYGTTQLKATQIPSLWLTA